MLFYSDKYKWSLPSELHERQHAPSVNRHDKHLLDPAVQYHKRFRMGSNDSPQLSGEFGTDASSRLVYNLSAHAGGDASVSDIRRKMLKTAINMFVNASKSNSTITHQTASINVDRVESVDSVDIDVNIIQDTQNQATAKFDLVQTSNAVTKVVEHTVDHVLQVFKNEHLNNTSFSNVKRIESNLITSVVNAFSREPASVPLTIEALMNKNTSVRAQFDAERENILKNNNIVNLKLNLLAQFKNLTNQLTTVNVQNVQANKVVISARVSQFSKSITDILTTVNFLSSILTAVDQSATFSVSQDLLQHTNTSHNATNESVRKDETFSQFLISGAILVGAVAVFILIIKILR